MMEENYFSFPCSDLFRFKARFVIEQSGFIADGEVMVSQVSLSDQGPVTRLDHGSLIDFSRNPSRAISLSS